MAINSSPTHYLGNEGRLYPTLEAAQNSMPERCDPDKMVLRPKTMTMLINTAITRGVAPAITVAAYCRLKARQSRNDADQWERTAASLEAHPESLHFGVKPKPKPAQRETEGQLRMRPYNTHELGPGLPPVKR